MQCEALLVLCHFSVHTAISQTHTLTQTDWHSIFQQTWSFLAVIFPPHGRPPPPRSLLHHVINTSLGMTECNHPPLLLQWHGYLQSHLINSPLDSMHIASISWLIKKKSAEMKQSFAPCAAYDRFDWMQNLQGNLRLPWFSSFCFFFFNSFFKFHRSFCFSGRAHLSDICKLDAVFWKIICRSHRPRPNAEHVARQDLGISYCRQSLCQESPFCVYCQGKDFTNVHTEASTLALPWR